MVARRRINPEKAKRRAPPAAEKPVTRKARKPSQDKNKEALIYLAKMIEETAEEVGKLNAQMAMWKSEAIGHMEALGTSAVPTPHGTHTLVRPAQRSKSEVDKAELYKAIKRGNSKTWRTQALELATFSVTAIRDHFAGKDADKIIKTTPPANDAPLQYQFVKKA